MPDLDLIEARIRAAACDDASSIHPDHAREIIVAEFGEQEAQGVSLFMMQNAAQYTGRKRLVQDALTLLRELKRRKEHDPDEVYQVRVQFDQQVLVSGSIEEIVREAFQQGYERRELELQQAATNKEREE